MQTLTRDEAIRMMAGSGSTIDTDVEETNTSNNTLDRDSVIRLMSGMSDPTPVSTTTAIETDQPVVDQKYDLFDRLVNKSISKAIPKQKTKPVVNKPVQQPTQQSEPESDGPQLVQGDGKSFIDKLISPLLPSWQDRVAKSQVALVKSEASGKPPSMFDNTVTDIIKKGVSSSTLGVIYNQNVPDLDTLVSEFNSTERLIYKAASLGADLPLMIASSMVGMSGGPVTSMGAAFAIPAGIRQVYVDRLQKGEVTGFKDFWGRLTSAVYESLKGEAIGVATGAAVPFGASAEIGTMTAVGAMLEMHVPTLEDIMDNAILLGGLKAGMHLTGKALETAEFYGKELSDIYASTGKAPKEAAKEIIEEVTGNKLEDVTTDELVSAQDRIREMINTQNKLETERIASNVPDELLMDDLFITRENVIKERSIKANSQVNWWLADAIKDAKKAKRRKAKVSKTEVNSEPIPKEEVVSKIVASEESAVPAEIAPADKVRLKNEQTKETKTELDSKDVKSSSTPAHEDLILKIEKQYGRSIDEISDYEIDSYFSGTKDVQWFGENESKYELSAKDLEMAKDAQDVEVLIRGTENKELFERVGTEDIDPVETSNSTSFRASKEKTAALAEMYKDRKIDNVEVYTSKLINDVNRWMDGDVSINIDSIRDQFNKAVVNAEKMKDSFENEYQFTRFNEMIKLASDWASKAQMESGSNKPVVVRRKKKGVSVNKLGMGVDPVDMVTAAKNLGDDIAKGARDYYRSFEKDFDGSRLTVDKMYKIGKEEAVKAFLERRGVLSSKAIKLFGDAGYKAMSSMYVMAGAGGRAKMRFDNLRREVFDGITRNKKKDLFALIDSLRMEAVGKYKSSAEFKFPEDRGPVNAIKFQEALKHLKGYTDAEMTNLLDRAKAYDRHIKSVLRDMHEEGVIGDAELSDLSSHYWREMRDLNKFDKDIGDILGGKKARISESGIKTLSNERRSSSFEMDAERLAADFYNMAFNKIAANKAAKNWLFIARNMDKNGFVVTRYKKAKLSKAEIKELSKEERKEIRDELKEVKIPKGFARFEAFEGGPNSARKTPFYVHPELAKDMITGGSKDMSARASNILSWMFMTKPLRFFATASAPIWSTLKALPIDIVTAMTTARVYRDGKFEYQYNSTLPISGLQIASDLIGTAKDAFFRGKQFEIYAENGGMMPFMVKQYRFDMPGAEVNKGVGKFMDVMTYYSESLELWTRLAVQRRILSKIARDQNISLDEVMKDKKATEVATEAARDMMDFNQGGWATKVLDVILPYTNVGVLGARNFFRMAKDDPARFTMIASQLAISSAGLTIANNMTNPEGQSGVSANDRARYRIIQLPKSMNTVDGDGNSVGFYYKIPLPPGMAVINSVFDTMTEKMMYEAGVINYEPDYDGVFRAIQSNVPYNATAMPPSMVAFNNYKTGIDLFSGRTIVEDTLPWPQSAAETKPYETPQMLEDIGEATGLSPQRLGSALEAVFTNSIYSYMVGGVYETLFGDLPDDYKKDHLFMTLAKVPGANSILGVSYPGVRGISAMKEREAEEAKDRLIRRNTVDAFAKFAYWKNSMEARKDLEMYLDKIENEDDYNNALKQSKFIEDITELKHKRFWLGIRGLSPEARGREYAIRYRELDASGRMQLEEEVNVAAYAGGWVNEKFWEGVDIEEDKLPKKRLFKK